MPLISIVMPAYNEEANIKPAVAALVQTFEALNKKYDGNKKYDHEIVFVSDGSKDGTFETIVEERKAVSSIKGIEFSRNFGKEAAIFAGLEIASGDAVIVMDSDLQHPVDTIPEMIEKWESGAEVVEGIKLSRGKEGFFHRMAAGTFYRIMSFLIKIDMNSSSDFKLLDRKVVDTLLTLPERNTFFRALSFWVGYKREEVYYEVRERQSGVSKWSFRSLVRYAIRNATSFSTLPLQLVTWMGWLSIVFGIVLGIQTLVKFFMGTSLGGFTTVILLILIIGGLLMLSLGIIGHYLGRIYEEVKGRPKYIISKVTDNISDSVKGVWKK